MLGLSTGLVWESANIINSPSEVEGLIGWWDFTDINQLYVDIDSYDNQVSSNNDKIGRCKNKAWPLITGTNLPISNKRLGTFARAIADANRPTYKTGGQNGYSYALLDNSSNIEGLVTRSTSTDWGAIASDRLSISVLQNFKLTLFIIGEPTDDDSDGVEEIAFSYFGYRGRDTSYADEEQSTIFTFNRQDDEDQIARWILNSDGGTDPPVPTNTINATQPASHWNSGETTILNMNTSTTAAGSYIYTNNVADTGQTIYWPGSGPAAQEGVADMDPSGYTSGATGFTTSVGVGGQTNANGVLSNSFEGKIYEILIYDHDLGVVSESDRVALNYYFSNKYNITIN